jgi:predicted ATPase
LPVPATPFLGRDRELREVAGLLRDSDLRLLALTGPGGSGKTRLALQAAAEASEAFPDGIWWVPLAPLTDPSLVLAGVAQALEIREQPGRDIAETLTARLAGKRTLVLLDNAEHLLPSVADSIARLRDIHGPTLLVTSRERLQLQGERLWDVPPLAEDDGVTLFSACARALDPAFVTTPAVEQVCSRLDNLPLALELAAARTRLFSPEQLLERLDQHDLLKGGRDADPRQQTLRATIEWSYDLLDANEQALISELSIFPGGCTFEAAEVVCGATLDALQSLLDKSLVRQRTAKAGRRYWMLQTIREFASEQLERLGAAHDARLRRAQFLATLGEQARTDTQRGEHHEEWFARLVDEADNLRVALGEADHIGQPPLRLGLAFAFAMASFEFGQTLEARAKLEAALAAADNAPPALRAHAQWALGKLAFLQADLSPARMSFREALELYRATANELGAGSALMHLGSVTAYDENIAEGKRLLEESREIFRRNGQMVAAVSADMGLALCLIQERDLAHADAVLERALERAPVKWQRPFLLGNLGLSALLGGRPHAAAARYRNALQELDDPNADLACYCLEGLAASWIAQRVHVVEATTLLSAAAATRAQLGTQPLADEYDLVERSTASARRLLGENRYVAVTAAGSAMRIDEAVENALNLDS